MSIYPQGLEEKLALFMLGEKPTKEEVTEAIQKYKPRIKHDWVTNPVQVDPIYQSFSNGIKAQDEMNPVTETASGFLTNKVCSFMSEPPPTLSSGSCDKDRLLVMKMNNLAFNLIRYYWHVG